MSSNRPTIMNHDFEDPPFEPIYYEGEEIEKQQLKFVHQPFDQSIDNYFNFQTPIMIRKEAEDRQTAEEAEKSKERYVQLAKKLKAAYKIDDLPDPRKNAPRFPAKDNPNIHIDESGWNTDTRTKGEFDNLKKNEIFSKKKAGKKEKPKTTESLLKVIKDNQANEPINFDDIADVEKALTKENSKTIKAIIKSNEAKLKAMEEQVRKEEKKTEEKNKQHMEKIQEILAVKKENERQVNRGKGFKNQPTEKKVQEMQIRSDLHPIMKPKLKSSNYGSGKKKGKGKGSQGENQQPKQYALDEPIDLRNFNNTINDDSKRMGVTWADELDLLKEGFKDQLKNPGQPNNRTSTPDRPSYHSGYQQPPQGETIPKPNRPQSSKRPTSRELAQSPIDFSDNLEAYRNAQVGPLPPYASDKHLNDINRLENQLKGIRNELGPIIQKLNTGLPSAGPNVELISASIGRLMKIHAEKLVNMLIDDVLVETISVLNTKEEMEKRRGREEEVKAMALALCEELNQIDVDQRFVFQKDVEASRKLNPFTKGYQNAPTSGTPVLPSNFALDVIHDMNEGYDGNARMPIRDFDRRDLMRFDKMSELMGKGPYKLDFADPTHITMDHNLLMKILRDQIMNEDRPGKPAFLRSQNQQAIELELNQIIDEELDGVLKLFEEAQEEFVRNVIKDEFS